MTTRSERRALLIAGPTASGKSAEAMRHARAEGGVVINADAMQVYRELRVLTARPGAGDEARVPHRLYGHAGGASAYSVARWLDEALKAMEDAFSAGQVAIFAGGTGLYFRALERGLAEIPSIPLAIRERWRSFPGDLHSELARRDPEGAARLAPGDRQRLVRALEVVEATGRPLTQWHRAAVQRAPLAGIAVKRIYLEVERAELHRRADARFDAMLAAGAIEEARGIIGYDPELPIMKAIGVPELHAYLRGELLLDEAVRRAKASTRQYIKRQTTWWRGQMRHWAEQGRDGES
jgi:tRNA dimethylallyltransferase